MRNLLLFFCAWSLPVLLYSQGSRINGRILDGTTGELIPYARVFINQTTIETTSGLDGLFELNEIPQGIHELVIAPIGYQPLLAALTIGTENIDVGDIGLSPNRSTENPDAIKIRDSNWEKHFKKFTKAFLGEGPWASSCEILNTYAISFVRAPGGVMEAYASEPIEVSNMALGYKLTYVLLNFNMDNAKTVLEGKVGFTEISTRGGATALKWMENRKQVYIGSVQHLFKSIIDERLLGEGFYLYKNLSTDRPSNFYSQVGNTIHSYDTSAMLSAGDYPSTYRVALLGKIEVHNQGKLSDTKRYNDVPYPVSWIEAKEGYVDVNRDGSPLHSSSLIVEGDMQAQGVQSMLPFNYKTENIVRIRRERRDIPADLIEEKVYVHTDKPYYYPGEMIWLKSYLNYRHPELKDSMSRSLHVELINPQRKIVKSAIFRIENGYARGNWILSDTLSSGNYFLRAYTNLNRNLGEDKLFLKVVPILDMMEKVDESEVVKKATQHGVRISTDRESYQPREKVTVTFNVMDEQGQPLPSNLSVSVTDANQVVPVKNSKTITDDFAFADPAPTHTIKELTFPVEYGINFLGQYVDRKRKPEKATLSILQGNFEHLSVIETDEEGMFHEGGLVFYDTAEFYFQMRDAKKKAGGRVRIFPYIPPALDFEKPSYALKTIETNKRQRLISDYEVPRGARLLQEVLIKGNREFENAVVRPYGNPDYVLKMEELDLSSNNLLQILQGKVPGLVIRSVPTSEGVEQVVRVVRASGLTILGPTEPLVMIDNVPLSGKAGDILQSINAYTVESVEVITHVSPAYGSAGANGIISVFLKKGMNAEYEPPENVLQITKIKGYTRPDFFRYPNYENANVENSQPDYRSIIYWDPEVLTDETGIAKVTFFTADLQTEYRVVVEGVNKNNVPVRAEHFFTIIRK